MRFDNAVWRRSQVVVTCPLEGSVERSRTMGSVKTHPSTGSGCSRQDWDASFDPLRGSASGSHRSTFPRSSRSRQSGQTLRWAPLGVPSLGVAPLVVRFLVAPSRDRQGRTSAALPSRTRDRRDGRGWQDAAGRVRGTRRRPQGGSRGVPDWTNHPGRCIIPGASFDEEAW